MTLTTDQIARVLRGNGLVVFLSAMPVAFILVYVLRYGQNLPYGDQLVTSVGIAIKAHDGELSFSDLVEQHNEHRIFFTHLLTAVFTKTSQWNVRHEMYASFVLAFLNLLIMILMVGTRHRRGASVVLIPLAFLVFSLRQRGNWLTGFNNQYYFMQFFLLLAILIIHRSPVSFRALVLAALSCLCSMYSLAGGVIAWPLIGVSLWLRGYRRPQSYLFWFFASICCLGIYFHEYDFISRPPAAGPAESLRYFFAYLGGPFVYADAAEVDISVTLGFLGVSSGILVLIYFWRAGLLEPGVTVWLAPALYALGSAAMLTISRAHLGPAQALSSKYVTHSSLLWISLSTLAVFAFLDMRERAAGAAWWKVARVLWLLPCVVMAMLYLAASRKEAPLAPLYPPRHVQCLRDYPQSGEARCLRSFSYFLRPEQEDSPKRARVLTDIKRLSERRLSLFAEPEAATAE